MIFTSVWRQLREAHRAQFENCLAAAAIRDGRPNRARITRSCRIRSAIDTWLAGMGGDDEKAGDNRDEDNLLKTKEINKVRKVNNTMLCY